MFLAFPSLLTDLNREHILCKRSHVLAVLNFRPAVWFRALATDDTTRHGMLIRVRGCVVWPHLPFHSSITAEFVPDVADYSAFLAYLAVFIVSVMVEIQSGCGLLTRNVQRLRRIVSNGQDGY